jgi:hypothetical protein
VPFGGNRVIAGCDHVVDVGDQLVILVNHHPARFVSSCSALFWICPAVSSIVP